MGQSFATVAPVNNDKVGWRVAHELHSGLRGRRLLYAQIGSHAQTFADVSEREVCVVEKRNRQPDSRGRSLPGFFTHHFMPMPC